MSGGLLSGAAWGGGFAGRSQGLSDVLPLVIWGWLVWAAFWGWLVWAMLRHFGRGLVCLWIGLPTGRSRWGGCAEEMGKCFDAGLLHAGRGGVCRKGRDVLAIWFVDGC